MRGDRAQGRRRWTGIVVAAVLAAAVPLGAATPADAAPKRATSLTLTSITHVPTKTDKGSAVVAGDRATLKGSASANLVGKTLRVQLRQGGTWTSYPGSGTVAPSRKFTIRIRATGSGTQTFRVRYAGSASLQPATATRSVKVWAWTRLVDLPVVSTEGSSTPEAAAHPRKNLVVAHKNRASLLAGTVPAGGTGAAAFELKRHCRTFATTVGLTDSSPAAGSITFSVYLDDVAMVVKEPKRGTTAAIRLNAAKATQVTLRNTEPSPAGRFPNPVTAAWPDARVLCDVSF